MIVVDFNILAYLYLPGERTAAAEALLEHVPDWAAPVLWRSEFRNILASYMRRKTLAQFSVGANRYNGHLSHGRAIIYRTVVRSFRQHCSKSCAQQSAR